MTSLRMCSVGDNVVDRYVEHGLWFPGGSAANVAVHAHRQGVAAGYIGILGNDNAGGLVRSSMREEGIDMVRVRIEDGPNAFTNIYLDADGNRHFGEHSAPLSRLELDSADLDYLRGCDWLHTGHSSATETQLKAMAGVAPVVFDFSHSPLDYARPLLEHITIAAFSRPDLDDSQCRDLIEAVCAQGPSTAVVTRGAESVIAWHGSFAVQEVSQVDIVDTLGAGDAFLATFAANMMSGASLQSGLALATSYAAQTCTHMGAYGHGLTLNGDDASLSQTTLVTTTRRTTSRVPAPPPTRDRK